MKLRKFTLAALCLLALLFSCHKDDNSVSGIAEADRTEQQVIDRDSLIDYLQTHYYNSSTFATPGDYHVADIIIKELPKDSAGNYLPLPDPDNNTILMDDIVTDNTIYLDVDYEYYYLKLNPGGGNTPHSSDTVLTNYSGMLQNDDIFDSTVNAESPFDMLNLILGWRLVMPEFKDAASYTENGDGTYSYSNYGLGMMFLPSGLGYFGSSPFGVPRYSNLIFKFELYNTKANDHDNDLVDSYLEDLDGDGNVYNDDTDADGIPNFSDGDDDGDGIGTRFEDINKDGDPTNDDTDGDGIPNYLDKDSAQSNQG
ncbi:MAG: hypothetical protein ABIO60_05135 [Aquaticitalea sp.]